MLTLFSPLSYVTIISSLVELMFYSLLNFLFQLLTWFISNFLSICKASDDMISKEVSSVFKNVKTLHKGIAFPTSVAVNNIVGNFSCSTEEGELKLGDVVKIDLGVQIGGYPAVVAHTIVVGATEVSGPTANVIVAAHKAVELAARLLKVDGDVSTSFLFSPSELP